MILLIFSGILLYLCGKIANMKEIYQYYASSDLLLKTYDELPDGFVSHEQLSELRRNCPVPDEEEVYSFLVDEGLFKELEDGIHITRRGRIFIHEGGFKGRFLRERRSRLLVLVGAISGVVAAIASILALLL